MSEQKLGPPAPRTYRRLFLVNIPLLPGVGVQSAGSLDELGDAAIDRWMGILLIVAGIHVVRFPEQLMRFSLLPVPRWSCQLVGAGFVVFGLILALKGLKN